MNKKLIILGNGFSIDFISQIKSENKNSEEIQNISLTNLFSNGDKVPCPWDINEKGFLSFENCPNLWTLGARPDISTEKANSIILDIVTSTNAFLRFKDKKDRATRPKLDNIEDKIYLCAYCELKEYIKSLMLYYNSLIDDTCISDMLKQKKWGWEKIFQEIKDPKIETNIITYNYDLWLERILNILSIEYDLLQNTGKNIQIIKPHGSINYVDKTNTAPFLKIAYSLNDSIKIDDIEIKQDASKKSIIIPPAGESIKAGSWSKNIRELSFHCAESITNVDKILICGISYWNVDRYEIDELLCSVDSECPICFINPNPPSEFNATLMSIFKKYKVFKTSNSLKNI